MNKEDYKYLLKMARMGADEMCGVVYNISHNRLDNIERKYKHKYE